MDDAWSWAIGAVALGLMSGLAGAGLVWRALVERTEADPARRDTARAVALLTFLAFSGVGVLVAASFIDADELDRVPGEIVAMGPRVAAAVVILIAGRAIALVAGSAVLRATGPGAPHLRSQLAGLVRVTVTSVAVVLALAEVGVDVVVLQITLAVLGGGLALAAALLVGLGGRDMAADLAAGRVVRSLVRPGDRVVLGEVQGTVRSLHRATVELVDGSGAVHHVTHAAALRTGIRVDPS